MFDGQVTDTFRSVENMRLNESISRTGVQASRASSAMIRLDRVVIFELGTDQ